MTPEPRGSRRGNRITALRWAAHLRSLGQRVRVGTHLAGPERALRAGEKALDGAQCELLIALHALRSAPAVERFAALQPGAPIFVLLTGTDIYGDPGASPVLGRTLAAATRIVVLQRGALEQLARPLRSKARVVVQSAAAPSERPEPDPQVFEVCALAHLRAVKDPFLLARAVELLPAGTSIMALHLGAALDEGLRRAAEEESRTNPRWTWLGELPRRAALQRLARARLFVSTSRSEGGPSALSEALATGLPVLATRIPACETLLGPDHPGLFPVGDAPALSRLLLAAEQDPAFLRALEERSRQRAREVSPQLERARIAALLAELAPP